MLQIIKREVRAKHLRAKATNKMKGARAVLLQRIKMNRKTRFFRYWLVLYVYMLIIFLASSMSFASHDSSGGTLYNQVEDIRNSIFHFVEYLILAILFIRAIRISYPKFNINKVILLSFAFSIVFAFFDEMHQYFVPMRHWEVKDLVIDGIGVLAGIILYKKRQVFSWRG